MNFRSMMYSTLKKKKDLKGGGRAKLPISKSKRGRYFSSVAKVIKNQNSQQDKRHPIINAYNDKKHTRDMNDDRSQGREETFGVKPFSYPKPRTKKGCKTYSAMCSGTLTKKTDSIILNIFVKPILHTKDVWSRYEHQLLDPESTFFLHYVVMGSNDQTVWGGGF